MALGAVPNKNTQIRHYAPAAGQAWVEGAIIQLAAGEISEGGADPTPILGFAACDHPLTPVDIYPTAKPVYVAAPGSTFWLEGSRAPLLTDEGVSYGLGVDGTGVAIVDATDTVATRVKVERVDLARNLWEVSVLNAHRILEA
jgi:hypothetical protein